MEAGTVETDAQKKRRSGSEKRQQNAKFQMRMTEEQRIALDEAARRNGFRDAKELVMFRLEQDLIAASLAAAS
mgnify:FL=1|jgi:hypothetical protein